jgi:hypothetical protein
MFHDGQDYKFTYHSGRKTEIIKKLPPKMTIMCINYEKYNERFMLWLRS